MAFAVSKQASYIVLYCVLSFFTFLAILSIPHVSKKVPEFIRSRLLIYGVKKVNDESTRRDYFLSARKAVGTAAVALSYFAASMGSWVFYGSSELGANPTISWIGVIGYSLGCAAPALLIMFLGPRIKQATEPEKVYSASDFTKLRYGRIMNVVSGGVALFNMFIFLTSELTSIGNIFSQMTSFWITSYRVSVTVSMGAFTIFYTALAGYPASMISDRIQAVSIILFIIMLLIATCVLPANKVTWKQFDKASNWTTGGLETAIIINIGLVSSALFDQSNWQRVYAADSDNSLRRGYFGGAILVFLVMMYFGILGMLGYAKDPAAYDSYYKYAYMSFFDTLEPLKNGWHIVVLLLACSLSASTIDTLQNAITSVFSHDFMRLRVTWDPLFIARFIVIAINVPAIYIATNDKLNILQLFAIGNLITTTCVVPVFLGLQKKDVLGGLFTAPTELGALAGCVAGVVTVIVNGYINGANQRSPFQYFLLKNGAVCAVCGKKTMWTFIIVPIVSGFFTYLVSFLDVKIRGERAREPIIRIAFDKRRILVDEESLSKVASDDDMKQNDAPQVVAVQQADVLHLPNRASEST